MWILLRKSNWPFKICNSGAIEINDYDKINVLPINVSLLLKTSSHLNDQMMQFLRTNKNLNEIEEINTTFFKETDDLLMQTH